MTLHYRTDAEDVGALNDWFFSNTSEGKNQIRRAVIGGTILLSLFVGLGYLLLPRILPILFIEWVIGVMLFVFLIPKRLKSVMRKRTMQQYEKSGALLGRRTVEINEEGVITLSEHTTSLYRWAAIDDIIATPTHVLLRVGPVQTVFIARNKVDEGNPDAFVAEAKRLHALATGAPTPARIPAA